MLSFIVIDVFIITTWEAICVLAFIYFFLTNY